MTQIIQLTAQDVCQALQIERHTLRRWLDGLPLFARRPTRARSARRYDMADITFLSAVLELETTYGLSLAAIARFDAGLHEALRGAAMGARFLFLDLGEGSCFPVGERSAPRPGITLDLEPVYRRVVAAFAVPTAFPELPFATQALSPAAAPV